MTREEFLNVALLQATEEGIGIHLAKFADICIKWGQQHPCWISVEDELPEVGVAVLTITPRGTQRVGYYEDGWWLANYIDLVRMGSITHWMPLPSIEHLKY